MSSTFVADGMIPHNETTKYVPLIIGDLHISDKYSGRHVDYLRDCIEFCKQITDEIVKRNVTHLFLTGDIFGRTTEKNLQYRETLLLMMQQFKQWNELTNGNVYSARGNHDYNDTLTDFEVFVSMGFIKTADYVDVGAIRFHLIDYGEHNREIDLDENLYNVAIMHTNLQIEGITTWFQGGNDGVELSSLENLYGVELVVAGHIHNPSVRLVTTSIRDKDISLFYPGNGTRPKYDVNIWNMCFGVMFETDGVDVNMATIEFKLRDGGEIFNKTYDEVEEDEIITDEPMFDIEQLSEIMQQLNDYNLLGEGDYKSQIIKFGGVDKEAVDLALGYIDKVEGEMK